MADDIDVFVSHNRKSKRWVRLFVQQLRAAGLKVFFDEDSVTPGANIVHAIDAALNRARHVVLIITPAALASDWVALESTSVSINDPAGQRATLIPLILEDVSSDSVPSYLRVRNAIDLRDRGTRDQQYRRLLMALGVSESTSGALKPPNPEDPHQGIQTDDLFTLPLESFYVQQRTRDLVIQHFPEDVCDLSALWLRADLSLTALLERARIYHPHLHREIATALIEAREAAYDLKYANMQGYEDERSLDPTAWEAEFFQLLRGLGVENTTNLSLVNVGIGNGREWMSIYSSCRRVVGVDVSGAALTAAANMHKELQTVRADACDLSSIDDGMFDIYVSLRTYQSTLFDVERSVLEATRVLKAGGIFIASLSDAHRVGGGIVRGILEPDSNQVDFDHPYTIAENVRRVLTSLGYANVGIRTGLFEVYVYGTRPG